MNYTVVWSGSMKTPLPGVGGLARKCSYLTELGEPSGDRQDQRIRQRCRCGRQMILVPGSALTTCAVCRSAQPCDICISLRKRCRRCEQRARGLAQMQRQAAERQSA